MPKVAILLASQLDGTAKATTFISELELEDPGEYRSMFKMDKDNFNLILNVVAPSISKQDTVLRQCISLREWLQVTLHYLARG